MRPTECMFTHIWLIFELKCECQVDFFLFFFVLRLKQLYADSKWTFCRGISCFTEESLIICRLSMIFSHRLTDVRNERHVHLSTIKQNNYSQPPSTNICPFQLFNGTNDTNDTYVSGSSSEIPSFVLQNLNLTSLKAI